MGRAEDWITCGCGKRGLLTRAAARRMARELRRKDPRSETLSTYLCDQSGGLWHVGHTNPHLQRANRNDPRLRFIPDPEAP